MLVTSIFSLFHIVFKRLLPQGSKKKGLCGKELGVGFFTISWSCCLYQFTRMKFEITYHYITKPGTLSNSSNSPGRPSLHPTTRCLVYTCLQFHTILAWSLTAKGNIKHEFGNAQTCGDELPPLY